MLCVFNPITVIYLIVNRLDTFQDKKAKGLRCHKECWKIVITKVFKAVAEATFHALEECTEFRFVRNVGRRISADSIHMTYIQDPFVRGFGIINCEFEIASKSRRKLLEFNGCS